MNTRAIQKDAATMIAVPAVLRQQLTARRNHLWFTLGPALVFLYASPYLGGHEARHGLGFGYFIGLVGPAALAVAVLVQWRSQVKSEWHYELKHDAFYAQNKLTLLRIRSGGWFWWWQTVTFPTDSVADIQRERRNGLPTLRVTLHKAGGGASGRPLFLIYADEDAQTVEDVFLPLLEQYRTL